MSRKPLLCPWNLKKMLKVPDRQALLESLRGHKGWLEESAQEYSKKESIEAAAQQYKKGKYL